MKEYVGAVKSDPDRWNADSYRRMKNEMAFYGEFPPRNKTKNSTSTLKDVDTDELDAKLEKVADAGAAAGNEKYEETG